MSFVSPVVWFLFALVLPLVLLHLQRILSTRVRRSPPSVPAVWWWLGGQWSGGPSFGNAPCEKDPFWWFLTSPSRTQFVEVVRPLFCSLTELVAHVVIRSSSPFSSPVPCLQLCFVRCPPLPWPFLSLHPHGIQTHIDTSQDTGIGRLASLRARSLVSRVCTTAVIRPLLGLSVVHRVLHACPLPSAFAAPGPVNVVHRRGTESIATAPPVRGFR